MVACCIAAHTGCAGFRESLCHHSAEGFSLPLSAVEERPSRRGAGPTMAGNKVLCGGPIGEECGAQQRSCDGESVYGCWLDPEMPGPCSD